MNIRNLNPRRSELKKLPRKDSLSLILRSTPNPKAPRISFLMSEKVFSPPINKAPKKSVLTMSPLYKKLSSLKPTTLALKASVPEDPLLLSFKVKS